MPHAVRISNFARALRDATRLWRVLLLAFGCSIVAASLWGANIAAIFPILEITLHGKSIAEWNNRRREEAETRLTRLEDELHAIESKATATKGPERTTLHNRLETLRIECDAERALAVSSKELQPLFERYLPNQPFHTVLLIIIVILFSTAIKQVCLVSNAVLVSYVSNSIVRDIRLQVFDKALTLDRSKFLQISPSGFTSQITQTTEMLSNGITGFYGGAVTEPLKISACLIGACFISWRLTIASLILAPLVLFLILRLNQRVKSISKQMLDRSIGFHHVLLEAFGSMQTVQAFTMEEFERTRFLAATSKMRQSAIRGAFYRALASPITELLGVSMITVAIAIGAYLVIYQKTYIWGLIITPRPLSISSALVFFGMLIGAIDPMRKLSAVIASINSGAIAANVLYPLLEEPSRIKEPAQPRSIGPFHNSIEFRNITFGYDPQRPVLQQVNTKIRFGERIAIVGANGSGKSTLVNLLCRFFDPQEGEILIDGVDIRQLLLRDLRGRIALVTQHTELFNETIFYNIRYGRWESSVEEVTAAAKQARAHQFIKGFSKEYETIVGPGGQRVSGGQRQRIALARAILRKAEILILDEATSQIDVQSEQLIHEWLASTPRDKTLIMITHRPSTIALADAILEINDGKLIRRQIREQVAA